jgi:very-short-patch-repair endonuclease
MIVDERITAILAQYVAEAGEFARKEAETSFLWDLQCAERRCESPIEVLMLGAIILEGNKNYQLARILPEQYSAELFLKPKLQEDEHPTPLSSRIFPQLVIGSYRVDFCLNFSGGFYLIVECDGHEWHDRTPEQAQRDKARDRALQAEGFQVLRFTGREIWADAKKCAAEVFKTAEREWSRRLDREDDEHDQR